MISTEPMDLMCVITMNNLNSKIFVAGSSGMVGSAIIRRLKQEGFTRILAPVHAELELMDQQAVARWFKTHQPEYVFLAAARVGGILANNRYPAEFIHTNLTIQNHLIHQSYLHGVKKLLFLGSSCIYPRSCPQPIKEEYLMTGALEPTNSAYAVAKIAGIEMCWSYNRQYGTRFIPLMPTNLYGPNDNFDQETSHVLPALIRKFHEAKKHHSPSVTVWGSGTPRREFLYVDDLAKGCLFVMQQEYPANPLYNIGTGEDITIRDLAVMIKEVVGYVGEIVFDPSKPDGTPRKLLDVSRLLGLGWQPEVPLEDGLRRTYGWFAKKEGVDHNNGHPAYPLT